MSADQHESSVIARPSQDEQEAPFIIWTFRRTGGTSLASLLYSCSSFESWQDEAFNLDRQLGHITTAYREKRNMADLHTEMAEVIKQRRNLKHTLDTVPYPVTSSLLRHATEAGYRHMVLLRLNEVERQLSLCLAEQTGAWGKHKAWAAHRDVKEGRLQLQPIDTKRLQFRLDWDSTLLGRLTRLLLAHRVSYQQVFYEDLYSGTFEDRKALLERLMRGLRLTQPMPDEETLRQKLMNSGQGSNELYQFIPNLKDVENLIRVSTE
jgi:hypothetical protein